MTQFIDIGQKEDSPQKLAYIEEHEIPEKYYVSSANIMLIVWAINQLKATAFTGDYGDLTNKPTLFKDWVAGSYLAGETVFHNGGIWISKSNGNESEPSVGATNWKLLAQINEGGVLGVNWENITGNQSAVSLSGFTNDGDGLHPFITAQDLSAFVQKIEGKGLSTNDFSDEFKSKLENLQGSKFVGTYPTIEELADTYPEGLAGGYADVGILGELFQRYEWSQSMNSWKVREPLDLPEGLIEKVAGIEDNAQVNTIEKIVLNGVEQEITDKTVNISVSTPAAILIESQRPIITSIGPNAYSVLIPMDDEAGKKSIWQAPSGNIFERTTDYGYTANIDLSTHNRIDVVWVDWDGEMSHIEGDITPIGSPTPYPAHKIPANAMQYTFITFINGSVGVQDNITPEQLQEVIDSIGRSNHIEINDNYTISDADSGKDVYLYGNSRQVTIPNFSTLLSGYNQTVCFIGAGGTIVNPSSAPIQGLPAGIDFPINIPQDGVVRFVRLNNLGSPTLRLEGDLM